MVESLHRQRGQSRAFNRAKKQYVLFTKSTEHLVTNSASVDA